MSSYVDTGNETPIFALLERLFAAATFSEQSEQNDRKNHLVTGGVLEHNPALSVKAPRQKSARARPPS